MPFVEQLRIVTEKEKTVSVAKLVKASTGDFDFYLFAVLGISMASLGLMLDSPEVIIGSMLIAPMLYPILSLSLGIVLSEGKLIIRSFRTLFISFSVSIAISYLLTALISPFIGFEYNGQIVSRAEPSTLYFLIACISGFAATYALLHTNLNEMLPGVAISVSLVPPLAVIGIGLATMNVAITVGAVMLFTLNVLGIILASTIVLTLMNVHGTHRIAGSAMRQEERRLEQEAEKINGSQQKDNA